MELHYSVCGEGKPIMILHGLFGSGSNWATATKKLSTDFQVFLVDLRNHGKSPHMDTMSYQEMADDVSSLIDKLRLKELTLVGHSMGGKVAMTLALSDSCLISQLIIVDIAPAPYPDTYTDILNTMNKMPENVLLSRKDADKYLREHILDKTTRQFILQNLIFVDGRLKWRLNIPCLIREMDKIVTWPSTKRSSCLKPTFFICGEHSDRVSEKNNRAIAAYFPNNTKHIVSGGSHWPQVEAPKEFLKILKNLLSPIDSKC